MILLLLIGSGSVVVGVISENPIQLIVGSLIFFGGTSIGFILMEDKK